MKQNTIFHCRENAVFEKWNESGGMDGISASFFVHFPVLRMGQLFSSQSRLVSAVIVMGLRNIPILKAFAINTAQKYCNCVSCSWIE
jgi:hypothetical protein